MGAFMAETTAEATPDVSSPDFWNDLYRQGDTGWDQGRAAPPIERLIEEGVFGRGPVLVVGAGRGHEALLLARRGVEVTAVDFAPRAAEAMRRAAADAGVAMEVLEGDLFDLPAKRAGAFAAVLEHTCFCAIDPERRPEYVRAMHAVLRPGGVLAGLFYAHGRPGGPPFTTDAEEVRRLFGSQFLIQRLTTAPDSIPRRAGHELEAVMERKQLK